MTVPDARVLTSDDAAAIVELGRLAFGAGPVEPDETMEWNGLTRWGVSDAAGRLLAKVGDRHQEHWFGGRRVSAAGIAGVAVTPEARGRGLALRAMRAAHDGARERGAVIGTLFRTAPMLYRRLGYEQVGYLHAWEIPTAALSPLRIPAGMSLRRAGADDLPEVQRVYESVASTSNGFMQREAPLFDWAEELSDQDGISLAVGSDGGIEGFCSWQRGRGYDHTSRVQVDDLFATTPQATVALLASLGSWAAATGFVDLRVGAQDAVHFALPNAGLRPVGIQALMLAVLDAAGAVSARGWPPAVSGSIDIELADQEHAPNSGRWRLSVEGAQGRLERGGSGATAIDVRGLAVLYAGAGDPALLRRAGLLTGGSAADDAFLSAAFAGPAPSTADYF